MVSESARVTTAREAAYRIKDPNSRPRMAKLIALDEKSAQAARQILQSGHERVALLAAPSPLRSSDGGAVGTVRSLKEWLAAFSGRIKEVVAGLDPADLVVLVATAGEDSQLATVIGDACRARGVPITALIIDAEDASAEALSASLLRLRPYASMLVVARGHDYVNDMLAALRV